jgi:hypothetical protein
MSLPNTFLQNTLQNTFTVTLSDVEAKAMHYFAVNPQEWIETAVQARVQVAMEEIFNSEIQRMMNDPATTSIPANKEEVIRNAQVKTAKERHEEAIANLNAVSSAGTSATP